MLLASGHDELERRWGGDIGDARDLTARHAHPLTDGVEHGRRRHKAGVEHGVLLEQREIVLDVPDGGAVNDRRVRIVDHDVAGRAAHDEVARGIQPGADSGECGARKEHDQQPTVVQEEATHRACLEGPTTRRA